MPDVGTIISTASSVFGIIVDSQAVVEQITGDTRIEVDSVPQTVDLFVGDAVKIEYGVTFTFVNSRLDFAENTVFDLRFLRYGEQVHRVSYPEISAIDNTTTARRLSGQLWL